MPRFAIRADCEEYAGCEKGFLWDLREMVSTPRLTGQKERSIPPREPFSTSFRDAGGRGESKAEGLLSLAHGARKFNRNTDRASLREAHFFGVLLHISIDRAVGGIPRLNRLLVTGHLPPVTALGTARSSLVTRPCYQI